MNTTSCSSLLPLVPTLVRAVPLDHPSLPLKWGTFFRIFSSLCVTEAAHCPLPSVASVPMTCKHIKSIKSLPCFQILYKNTCVYEAGLVEIMGSWGKDSFFGHIVFI